MPVLDQVGRAFVQFNVILALIVTPIDLVLAASGMAPPGPLAAAYVSPKVFMAIRSSGAALAAMLVFGYSIYTFLLNLFAGMAGNLAAMGAGAARALGGPSVGTAVGGSRLCAHGPRDA